MPVKLALSALDVVKAKTGAGSADAVIARIIRIILPPMFNYRGLGETAMPTIYMFFSYCLLLFRVDFGA